MRVHRTVTALLALCASLSPAFSRPPDFPDYLAIPRMTATLSRKPALHFRIGRFAGTLEKTTLAEAKEVLGGRIYENGKDGADHAYFLCYSLVSPDAVERVWFSSSAEMGGLNREIGEVAAILLPVSSSVPSDCPSPPRSFQKLTVGNGLHLRMTAQEVIRLMGQPSGNARDFFGVGGHIGYAYDKPVDVNDPALGQEAVSLRQENTVGGKVNGLLASRVTSN
jgi:hypothetical protein